MKSLAPVLLHVNYSGRDGREEWETKRFSESQILEKWRKLQLHEHPWLSLLAVMVTTIVSIILANNLVRWIGLSLFTPADEFIDAMIDHSLMVFFFAPFVLRLPEGKRTFRQYLDDVGLTRMRPFIWPVLLALSCYAILELLQATEAFVFRFSGELPITWSLIQRVFDMSGDLPPGSSSLPVSFPSILEEVVFRCIVLTVFPAKYSERKAIIFSSLGF